MLFQQEVFSSKQSFLIIKNNRESHFLQLIIKANHLKLQAIDFADSNNSHKFEFLQCLVSRNWTESRQWPKHHERFLQQPGEQMTENIESEKSERESAKVKVEVNVQKWK